MSSKILVISDWEDGYVTALAAYISGRKELAVRVITCKTIQGIKELQKEMKVDYLLVSSRFKQEEREQLKARKKFLLSETMNDHCGEDECVIYKYQPGDAILSLLLKNLSEDTGEEGILMKAGNQRSATIIGVYSPVHRIGKTRYALDLGQRLAGKENVLYLNLELFGGYGGIFPDAPKQTLADVLYYARQERKNLHLFLTTMAEQMGHMDYIAPAPISEDVKSVSAAEWTNLLTQIAQGCFYETIVVDVDEGIQGLYQVLDLCDEIHLLTVNEPVAAAKVRQFEGELQLLGYDALISRIIQKEQHL